MLGFIQHSDDVYRSCSVFSVVKKVFQNMELKA